MSRRRARGTGSLFQKSGCATWSIKFYKDGKRIRESTGLTNRAEAQRVLTKRLHEVDKNELAKRERKPVRIEELYAALQDHQLINRQGRPRELPGRWRHLGPAFGPMRAANLTTDDVRHYIRQRQRESASNATINRELATLKRMLNFGRQSTPPKVRAVPYIPMLTERNVRTGFVEDEAFSRLTAEASELWLRTFLELAFSYGWRRSELLGLRVRHVNLREGTIRLDVGSTKNGEGREVEMTARVRELLQACTQGKTAEDFVLTRANGKPVRDFRDAWKDLTVRAGLGGLLPHDLRRSAAKALRAAGVAESVIMSMGGWKTPAMFRRYAIVSRRDQRDAIEKLERARRENGPDFGPHSAERDPADGAAKVQ